MSQPPGWQPPPYPPYPPAPRRHVSGGWTASAIVFLAALLYLLLFVPPRAEMWHACGASRTASVYLAASMGAPSVIDCLGVAGSE